MNMQHKNSETFKHSVGVATPMQFVFSATVLQLLWNAEPNGTQNGVAVARRNTSWHIT